MTPAGFARTIPISPGMARTRAPVTEPVHHALAATLWLARSRRASRGALTQKASKGWEGLAKLSWEGLAKLALLWQILAIDWRNWIPESGFQ